MNKKLVLETLANLIKRVADLQYELAGLVALVESNLPNLTPEQRARLQKGIETQTKDSEALKLSAERLQQALDSL